MDADRVHSLVARYLIHPEARDALTSHGELDSATARSLASFAALIARVRHNQLVAHFPQTFSFLERRSMLGKFFLHYEPRFQSRRKAADSESAAQREAFRSAIDEFAREGVKPVIRNLIDLATHECTLADVRWRSGPAFFADAARCTGLRWNGDLRIIPLSRQFVVEHLGLPIPAEARNHDGKCFVIYAGNYASSDVQISTTDEGSVRLLKLLIDSASVQGLLEMLRASRADLADEDLRCTLQCFVDIGLFEWNPQDSYAQAASLV